MAAIASLRADFYRIPLPAALTDSTHGHAIAPDGPGHGVAFDWKALESSRA